MVRISNTCYRTQKGLYFQKIWAVTSRAFGVQGAAGKALTAPDMSLPPVASSAPMPKGPPVGRFMVWDRVRSEVWPRLCRWFMMVL